MNRKINPADRPRSLQWGWPQVELLFAAGLHLLCKDMQDELLHFRRMEVQAPTFFNKIQPLWATLTFLNP